MSAVMLLVSAIAKNLLYFGPGSGQRLRRLGQGVVSAKLR